MKSETILLLNFSAYLSVFVFFINKDKYKLSINNVGFLWLAFSALSSYLFYIQPGFVYTVHYSEMTITPFIYLFVALVLLFLPLRKLKQPTCDYPIRHISVSKMQTIRNFCLPFLIFLTIAELYSVMNVDLSDMAEIRSDLYEGTRNSNPLLNNWFSQTISRVFGNSIPLFYCISFYYLVSSKKKKILDWVFIIIPYILGLEHAFSTATRSTILFMLMVLIFMFLLYKELMTTHLKRVLLNFFIVFGSTIVLLLFLMSISRFSDNAQLFFYKYAGEAMINFNGLMFNNLHGTTDGNAYFWYFLKFISPSENFSSLNDKWDYIFAKTGVSGQYFYTCVGGFLFEFGKIWTLIVIGVLSYLMAKFFSKRNTGLKLIIISWVAYQLIASVFLFPIQGDGGIIQLACLIIFYIYAKEPNSKSVK